MTIQQTYCPRLWNEIYIDKDGSVYTCCHNKPKCIGNIYNDHLKVICNNKVILSLRKKSLTGKLECFHECNLLSVKGEKNKITKKPLKIDYNNLTRLKILFGEACNLNCIMCWQNSNDKFSLDYEKLIKHIDIKPFKTIEILGGEPLFIESAKKFFDYIASKNKKVSFLTNGTLINDVWAKKIALHSLFVYFSLNAATKNMHESINRGSKWEVVQKNIQRVRKAREKFHTNVKIIGHMTIIIKNLEEIPLFIEQFKSLGFDLIEFGYDASVPAYLLSHQKETKDLKQKIKTALNKSENKSRIKVHRLKLLGLISNY